MKTKKTFLVVVIDKTLYIHFEECQKKASITISNTDGKKIHEYDFQNSFHEIIKLDHPRGKYRIKIESEQINGIKTIQI
ncbi:MAG: hypothetical protein DRJ05_03285 [Bacteroidetes bacterium]|nr:MAG: hypothetical protein DRJ05_03285 [Bacteroidota bacterium]